MREYLWMVGALAGLGLVGCGGARAEVEGSAGGVSFGKTSHVFFGGPYVVISMVEVDCESLDYVRRNYEVGQSPTDTDSATLQLSSMDLDSLSVGTFPVKIDAAVSASIVDIVGGTFTETVATAGVLTVYEVDGEDHASGSFEGLVFEDGTLDGSFDAEWCRNLKAQ